MKIGSLFYTCFGSYKDLKGLLISKLIGKKFEIIVFLTVVMRLINSLGSNL